MKKLFPLFFGIVLIASLNYKIWQNEKILSHGETLFLELAPVDPRSLMQGDYMRLAFAIEREIDKDTAKDQPKTGRIILTINEKGIAEYVGFYEGKALLPNQRTIRYQKSSRWNNSIEIQPRSYFFQEGHRPIYENAKYGIYKYKGKQTYLLQALADKDLNLIKPKTETQKKF